MGKSPSKTMGATSDGTEDVGGCDDDGGSGGVTREKDFFGTEAASPTPHEGGRLVFQCPVRGAPMVPQNMHALVFTWGSTRRAKNGDGRLPPKGGTKWLSNADKESWRSRRLSTRSLRTEGTSHWTVRRSTARTARRNPLSRARPGSSYRSVRDADRIHASL